MGERDAGGEDQRGETLPVGDAQIFHGDAGGLGRGDRLAIIVPRRHPGAAGGQRQRRRAAAGAEAEHGNAFAGKGGDGGHVCLNHLILRLDRPMRARRTAMIQKRITICASVQPSASK